MASKILENLSMFLLVALAALRPLISERYDSAPSGFGLNVTGIADPSPVTTVIFDCLILVAAFLCVWARAIRTNRRFRWTGLEVGAVIVLIAGITSCFFASNARLALNATIDWVCLPIATITLVQLLRFRWQRQIVVMVVLASACVQVWQVFDFRIYGLESMWEHYIAGKEAFWQNRGIPLDAPTVELFERRIQANEAQGFFPHSNVASSYLVLCLLVATGVAVELWRRVRSSAEVVAPIAMSVVGVAMLAAIGLTKSLGGFVSLGAGLLLTAALMKWHRWIDANRRKAFAIGWIGFGVGVVAAVGHGAYHGSLPGASLNFRWQYWTASAEMIADHPWTGVGRENFGRNYLHYKSIESSEEVANPHNLFVQAASDWGLPGLAGALFMCVGATWTLVRRPAYETESDSTALDVDSATVTQVSRATPLDPPLVKGGRKKGPLQPKKGRLQRKKGQVQLTDGCSGALSLRKGALSLSKVVPWAVGGLATVTAGRMVLLGSDDANWVYYQTATTGIAWVLGFFVVAAGFWSMNNVATKGRGLRWESFVVVALFTFVLHELVNFAMFVPGSAYTFFVLLAIPIATRFSSTESTDDKVGWLSRWIPVVGVLLALIAVGLTTLTPVARAHDHLKRSRTASGAIATDDIAQHPAARECELAGLADPIDPTPYVDRARWMMGVASIEALRNSAAHEAEHSLNEAIKRDPVSVQLRRMRLRFYLLRAREPDGAKHYDAAIAAAKDVLKLYPQSPADIVALADVQLEASQVTSRPMLATAAIESYRRALALDDQRPDWEIFQRLQTPERRRVEAKIIEAQELAGG
jgi:O-Antigen ligase